MSEPGGSQGPAEAACASVHPAGAAPHRQVENKEAPTDPSPSLVRRLALLGTVAAGACMAAATTAFRGNQRNDESSLTLCGTALAAVGGAALTVGSVTMSDILSLRHPDAGHRRRAAAITRPSRQTAVRHLSEETITIATALMQQASDEAEEERSPNTLSAQSSGQPADVAALRDDLENRPFALLGDYSLQQIQDPNQLQHAPWATLLAHQRLESTISQMSYEELCRQFNGRSHPDMPHRSKLPYLPTKVFQSPGASSSSREQAETRCPICLDDFKEGQIVRMLPHCGHCFCIGCVDQWLLDHSRSCPTCRSDI